VKKPLQMLVNIESLYLSMAIVFFLMAVFRIMTAGAGSHELSHLIISAVYLVIGIIYLIWDSKRGN